MDYINSSLLKIATYIRNSTFLQDFGGVIVSALVFVVSFLWKDLFEDIETVYFPKNQGVWGRIIYIMTITMITLLIVSYLKDTLDLDTDLLFDDAPEHHR